MSDKIHSKGRSRNSNTTRLLDASQIKLTRLQAGIDHSFPVVEEISNNLITYHQPFFIAKATLEVPPLAPGFGIQVGWIQVITKGICISNYDENKSLSYEVPEMVTGKEHMMNDSTGEWVPWYDNQKATKVIKGPTQDASFVNIEFLDRPESSIPLSLYKRDESTLPTLNFSYRKNRFYTYLVFKNLNEENYHIIKTLTWVAEVAIGVNPNKPLGKRVEFIGPCEREDPKRMTDLLTPPLEKFALQRPTANDCCIVIVRSKGKKSVVLREPTETTVNLKNYVPNTQDYSDVLANITLKNFLKRYIYA